MTYRLVTPEESDPAQGLISTTSPVGRSLMGKQEGDEVVVRTPAGARNLRSGSCVRYTTNWQAMISFWRQITQISVLFV